MESLVIPGLFGAIATLFGLLSAFQQNRIKKLESDVTTLEEENKSYVALFMMLSAGDEESLQKVRKRASQILRGDNRVELD